MQQYLPQLQQYGLIMGLPRQQQDWAVLLMQRVGPNGVLVTWWARMYDLTVSHPLISR